MQAKFSEHRQQAKAHTDAATEMVNLLKAHMQAEQVSEVIDGERQLRAYIQERTGWEWDLRGASAGILIALQESGLLKVDNALFEAMRKGAPSGPKARPGATPVSMRWPNAHCS